MVTNTAWWKKGLHWTITMIAAVYVGVIVWYCVTEDSFVYFPREGLRNADSINIGIETIRFHSVDGVELVGWIVPAAHEDSSKIWFLYLHGNGGNISSRGYVDHYKAYQAMGVNTFAVDYRGYGLSKGRPSEQGLYNDAQAAFRYLTDDRHVPSHNIIIFGYSLGSAVAVDLASKVDAGGLILEGAFTSLPSVGQRRYPVLPVNWIMSNRFDSFAKISHVNELKLFLHALHDEVIPYEEGRALFAGAPGPKEFIVTGGGHNTAHTEDSTTFYREIAQFLEGLERYMK